MTTFDFYLFLNLKKKTAYTFVKSRHKLALNLLELQKLTEKLKFPCFHSSHVFGEIDKLKIGSRKVCCEKDKTFLDIRVSSGLSMGL
jgi:hypothetical protein